LTIDGYFCGLKKCRHYQRFFRLPLNNTTNKYKQKTTKMKKTRFLFMAFCMSLLVGIHSTAWSQGVTTSALEGTVMTIQNQPLADANVVAVHTPSGTRYGTISRADGRFNLPNMRVGGPYTITVSYVGFQDDILQNVNLSLGETRNLSFFLLETGISLDEVVISGMVDGTFNSGRTGASTNVSTDQLSTLPTITRRINDFTRLTPQASGGSFAGQDNRLNNITVDGSYFNNSFGLGGQPGDRTGVAPISLSAIEQISVNIAPYDVRQGNFVGAGVNTVTKSGTNVFKGDLMYNFRNANGVGREAGELAFNPGAFKFREFGATLGGPIIKNRLFFFVSYEQGNLTEPGTTYLANTGGQTPGGNITRVNASDLDGLSNFLRTNFNYETGPYAGYEHETPSVRFLAKINLNINTNNTLSLRYTHLDSKTDVLASNSSSLGAGNRRSSINALNFQNSNYQIMENIRSFIAELNSRISNNISNSFIAGYTFQDESRASRGQFFPMVDILQAGTTYTTFGFEPFTPNNELRYSSYQLQNNLSIYTTDMTWTFGISAEMYESENIFFPGSQSVYIYNSLEDFYTDANDYLANPNRTTSPINLNRFQVRYSNIPGQDIPIQPLQVLYTGIYGQNEWQVTPQLKLTGGLRLDVPIFADSDYRNTSAEALTFKDENGNDVSYRTDKMPDPKIHWSPRLGFNFDPFGDRSTQLRGGTGIFTGRPAYVWISNQVGNNGLLTGFNDLLGTNANPLTSRPFNPNPNQYKPTNVTGEAASSYELALSDPDFKFPQIWRTNLAIDQRLPFGINGTLEFLFSQDVNGVYYINANLIEPTANLSGADDRPLYPGGNANRINSNITSAIVLKNQNQGYSYNIAASLEKPFQNGLFAKAAYSYGISKNTVDPGSIAFGSWSNNAHSNNPNNPGIGYSANSMGHRIIGALTYRTPSSTTFGFFWESRNIGNTSYIFNGDMNRDGNSSNDLIYIPNDKSEMNFYEFTASGRTFTVAEQQDAWDAFIEQDAYLSKNRGKYAERGAVLLPMLHRLDFSISHDLATNIAGSRNAIQLRFDIINFTNMLNKEWGVAKTSSVNSRPLVSRPNNAGGPVDANNKAIYRMANIGADLPTKSFENTLAVPDVFQIMFGIRYMFN
jgi:hypothetical protein